jgi:Domain of unknown function (DUF1835)
MDDAILRGDASLHDDRRLNLEQQKTRAKELRRAVAAGEPDAVARVLHHHPGARDFAPAEVPARLARLSDAQLVIARELGLPSWPKLKAHVEHLERARRAIESHHPAPDADLPTLHLRCGTDIRERLRHAGFAGDFLEVSDPYCQGPVPREGDLIAIRARFIASAYRMSLAEATARLTAEYEGLARAADHDRVVLWFEHDSYDQLILARVLAAFAERQPRILELICIDRFPVVTRFKGLGQLSPVALRSLWESRRPVTTAQLRLGTAVWHALREPSPAPLHAIAASRTPELPLMAPALARHLQELPSTRNGLSLTQALALAPLREGPQSMSALFRAAQRDEPLVFLGDLMFWAALREMQEVARPPFVIDPATADGPWPQHLLTLTPTGAALLEGELDWMSLRPPVRWVGGVEVGPGLPDWRWSAEREAPVLRG